MQRPFAGLGGSVPPYGGIPFGYFPAGLGHDLGCPERPFAWAWAIRRLTPMSSLTLLPWGGCRNLLEAQPSNPWTVTGSVPFYRVCSETSSAVLDCLSLSWVFWPFHLVFTCPFRSDGGLVCRAYSGLSEVAGRAPSLYVRGPSGVPLAFYTPLVREGLFAEAPLGASPGRGVSAYPQEGPPSLCIG